MKARKIDFSREMDPRRPLQDPKKNFITLKPKLNKRVILRNRDLNKGKRLVQSIEGIRTQ